MDISDEQLAELSKTGDDTAFEELVHRYVAPIYRFALHYTRNPEDAEDISQDAFYKAWKHIKRHAKGKPFKPWIFAIARNTALDFLKKRKVHAFSTLDGDETDISFAETLEDTEPLQPELFEREELSAQLTELMEILHPDHRSVLILHYRESLTFEEISDVLGKPMNTVKSWHRRALIKIRNLLHQNTA
ncbi:MAG: RNA polymerase sigma factor [Patescibacteria group bacterium]